MYYAKFLACFYKNKNKNIMFPFNLGPLELSIIAFLALIFFGRDKLPTFARDLGSSMKEFKSALSEATQPAEEKTAAVSEAKTGK